MFWLLVLHDLHVFLAGLKQDEAKLSFCVLPQPTKCCIGMTGRVIAGIAIQRNISVTQKFSAYLILPIYAHLFIS